MFNRLKSLLQEFLQQADLLLLTLCLISTGYGIVLITSATRYTDSYRNVLVQSAATVLGLCAYIFLSMVDVEDLARTAFILEMDTKTLCSEDCKGLCHRCGADLNLGPCSCKKDVDPRMAALAKLLENK